jgi:hypothetical protein
MRYICGHPGAEYFALGGVLTFDVMLWRDARRVPPPLRRGQVAAAIVALAPVVVILLDLLVPLVP